MRRVSESLAGRASYLTLWPMTRREQLGLGRCGIWENLVESPDRDWLDIVAEHPGDPEDWRALARRGGFPVPAVHLDAPAERAIWFDGYVRTYLERDLQALSSITALPDLSAAHARGGPAPRRVAQSDGGGPGHRPPAADGTPLAEPAGDLLPARADSPVLGQPHQAADQGSQGVLERHGPGPAPLPGGRTPGSPPGEPRASGPAGMAGLPNRSRADVLHWRTTTGEEVDFVIEADGSVLPIEVKATRRPRLRDAAHLRSFRAEYGRAARAGLLLHGGDSVEWITPEVLAAPWWKVV